MDPYKQVVDEWLEEAPCSAIRILEKLREMGFDGGYSIVKAYVSGRKKGLDEKAAVRFEKTSTVFTSNKTFSQWDEVFADVTIASAILDRVLHHCTVINIKGKSYHLLCRHYLIL